MLNKFSVLTFKIEQIIADMAFAYRVNTRYFIIFASQCYTS